MATLRFLSAGATHPGLVREVNEDHFCIDGDHGVWVVADGMGGHASGQTASRLAVQHIIDFMTRWRHVEGFIWPFDIDAEASFGENSVMTAIRVGNVRVYNHALVHPQCSGMGTTVVMLHYEEQLGLVIGHVGDSRCYRLRHGQLARLTSDHSLARQLAESAQLSESEAQAYVGSNVILRAVGVEDDIEVDCCTSDPCDQDVYLLCSDGLSDLISDETIQAQLIQHAETPSAAVSTLISMANQAGGHDNITAIVIRIEYDLTGQDSESTQPRVRLPD
ncbi:MAG: protein phosphatase 2C domain-containing protein [Myxococcota bacterium]|nr:protein phosphatase 2C domain-containing protein [Myxococcota bacterium]